MYVAKDLSTLILYTITEIDNPIPNIVSKKLNPLDFKKIFTIPKEIEAINPILITL